MGDGGKIARQPSDWALTLWQGSTRTGPYPQVGPLPQPGDLVTLRLGPDRIPVEVRIIRIKAEGGRMEAIAVASGATTSARWQALHASSRAAATTTRLEAVARVDDEKVSLTEMLEELKAKERARMETPAAMPAAVEEPPSMGGSSVVEVGDLAHSVLGRTDLDHVSTADLRQGLLVTLRTPIKAELGRLAVSDSPNRAARERKLRKILEHLDTLREVFDRDGVEDDSQSKLRLVRWIVLENAMLREDLRRLSRPPAPVECAGLRENPAA